VWSELSMHLQCFIFSGLQVWSELSMHLQCFIFTVSLYKRQLLLFSLTLLGEQKVGAVAGLK